MLRNKVFIIRSLIILVAFTFLVKLFNLQIMDPSIRAMADDTAYREITLYPVRGLIYDRNGKLTVYNDILYDLNVIPNQLGEFDTAAFCDLLPITKEELIKRLAKASERGRAYVSSPILKQISPEDYARFSEYNYKFPAFHTTVRTIRKYPYACAAHVLGNIGEVDSSDIIASEYYYKAGDYIGKSGIEKTYEQILRGSNGIEYVLVDRLGRQVGKLKDGVLDSAATAGKDIATTLDIELQKFAEELMQNKKGSVVAIEPSTGEILTFVSSPAYDPNLLVGRERGRNFNLLQADPAKPLFNRPLQGQYPPGSTYKPIMALLAMQDGAITPSYSYPCTGGGYRVGSLHVGCHGHGFPKDVNKAIQYSCNAYFCHIFRMMVDAKKFTSVKKGYRRWYEMNRRFGLGDQLSIDLPGEKPGFVPDVAFFDDRYKGHWKSSMVLSLSIGQGEMQATPLQLANLMAIIANRGFYITPHLVKSVDGKTNRIDTAFRKFNTMVEPYYFDSIKQGMQDAVGATGGTARLAAIDSILVCGKTGTAQNAGKDHSLFVAFAPRENPKIAIAVVVENSGFGGTWAAPIAGLIIEQYLNGEISQKKHWLVERMKNANLIEN